MQLVIPKKWQTVDLLKTNNANLFGEALRGFCFVGSNYDTGCYDTFDVIEQLKEIKSGKFFEEAKKHLYDDIKPKVYHYKLEKNQSLFCDPFELVVGWTWDGDGCLYIRFNDRAVVNPDCKCDYYWRWINDS